MTKRSHLRGQVEVVLCSVEEIDEFISDPAHTSYQIQDLVENGKTESQITATVQRWLKTAVTDDKSRTYRAHRIALARFVKREMAIATARIACDAEDRATKCVHCCKVLTPAELRGCKPDHDETCRDCGGG